MATGRYANIAEQLKWSQNALKAITTAGLTTWKCSPSADTKTTGLASITQNPEESCTEFFFARLPEAVERAVPSSEARDIILKQLVYENASTACQSVLRRVKKMGSISDYIRASMDIGPSYFQGVVIAATLQGCATTQFLNNQQQRQPNEKDVGLECFSCRHMGHISKRCPFKEGSIQTPILEAIIQALMPQL